MKTLRLALGLLALCCAAAAVAQPTQVPAGKERETLIAGIRKSYPKLPEKLVEEMADSRRQVSEESSCQLLDWMTRPGSGSPLAGRVEAAKEKIPSCILPINDITAEAAAARLAGKDYAVDISGDAVTIVAHSKSAKVSVCCTIQGGMRRLGASDYWADRRRLSSLNAAMLGLSVWADDIKDDFKNRFVWRGPDAPPAPVRKDSADLKGQLLERELASKALGETRKLSIYLPPGWSKERALPVVFMTDGNAESFATMVEPMIEANEIAPIVIVSALSAPEGIVGPPPPGDDLRSIEYIRDYPGPGADKRFANHMTFFAEEMTRYAIAEFGVSPDRASHAVGGYSNGGVFAILAGVMHPEAYSAVVGMSPGSLELDEKDLRPTPRARFLISGGFYESGFRETAKTAEKFLKDHGYDATGRYLVAGHDPGQWDVIFHDALKQLFPPR